MFRRFVEASVDFLSASSLVSGSGLVLSGLQLK